MKIRRVSNGSAIRGAGCFQLPSLKNPLLIALTADLVTQFWRYVIEFYCELALGKFFIQSSQPLADRLPFCLSITWIISQAGTVEFGDLSSAFGDSISSSELRTPNSQDLK